jgi:transcriptional regulator with XRE-family HTH domain
MGLGNDLKAKAIVANIRKIRSEKNYTQDYLAAKLGISQNAYSKVELGYSNITLNRLIEIADILEVDFVEFITREKKELVHLKVVNDGGH